MSLVDRVNAALKDAMRSKDAARLRVIRAIRGEILTIEKAGGEPDLSDDRIQQAIKALVKQRQDAAESFRQAKRPAQAEAEEADIPVLREFLPEALTEAELDALVARAATESGAASPKDMGLLMKTLKPLIGATGKDADNREVAARAKAYLAG